MTALRTVIATNLGLEKVSVYQRVMDYLILTKPRMVVMVLAVTVAGFYMGTTGTPNWVGLLNLLVGVSLASGGTLALNQYFERNEDALMERTQLRPLPDGRIQPLPALCFGVVITVGGLLYLTFMVHALAGLVTAVTTFTYLFWYTPLKLKSSLCSVVGAIPGALPPVTGWVAARGSFDAEVWVLFAILFLWQIPHALAIAWLYRDDFARAGFRLLPVLYPDGRSTGRQIIIHSLALLGAGLLPTLIGMAGAVYFIAALILGLAFLGFSIDAALSRTNEAARRLMFASLVYLPLVYLLMALDKSPGILG
jgi:protoheme IX farnesyltransferase